MQEIRIIHSVKSSQDLLIIKEQVFDVKPKIKFVRRKEIKKLISNKIIAQYKIDVPYHYETIEREEWRDYTHFHNDCELVKWTEKIKVYKQPDLKIFIDEKMKNHTTPKF